MEFRRSALEELDEEYLGKRIKGLQHLVLRYASLNPEIDYGAPQADDYDLDGFNQPVENIQTLEERLAYERPRFDTRIEEYPENIKEFAGVIWSEEDFDKITLRKIIHDVYKNVNLDAGRLGALYETDNLGEGSNDLELEKEMARVFNWIREIDTSESLTLQDDYPGPEGGLIQILPEKRQQRERYNWEVPNTTSEEIKRYYGDFVEEVDSVIKSGNSEIVIKDQDVTSNPQGFKNPQGDIVVNSDSILVHDGTVHRDEKVITDEIAVSDVAFNLRRLLYPEPDE